MNNIIKSLILSIYLLISFDIEAQIVRDCNGWIMESDRYYRLMNVQIQGNCTKGNSMASAYIQNVTVLPSSNYQIEANTLIEKYFEVRPNSRFAVWPGESPVGTTKSSFNTPPYIEFTGGNNGIKINSRLFLGRKNYGQLIIKGNQDFTISRFNGYGTYTIPLFRIIQNGDVLVGEGNDYGINAKLRAIDGDICASQHLTSSDTRLKTNIKNLDNRSKDILSITGKSYQKTEIKTLQKNDKTEFGFLAQDIQKIYPELVHGEGEYLAVNYTGFIPLIAEKIKEQSEEQEYNERLIELLKEKLKEKLKNVIDISASTKENQVNFNLKYNYTEGNAKVNILVYNLITGQLVWKKEISGSSETLKNETIVWSPNLSSGSNIYVYKAEITNDDFSHVTEGKKISL